MKKKVVITVGINYKDRPCVEFDVYNNDALDNSYFLSDSSAIPVKIITLPKPVKSIKGQIVTDWPFNNVTKWRNVFDLKTARYIWKIVKGYGFTVDA